MAKYLEATVNFANIKKGDFFYAFDVPSNAEVEPYCNYKGKLVYISDDVFYEVSPNMFKIPNISFEEAKNFDIKEVAGGVQDEEDFFSTLDLSSWELDYSRYSEFVNRSSCKFFDRWLCTDTYVGKGILAIDGVDVAFFHQNGRKNPCNYKWFSKEAKNKAYNFAKEFIEEGDMDYNDVVQDGENLVNFFI